MITKNSILYTLSTLIGSGALMAMAYFVTPAIKPVLAASASNWQSGSIIADGVFYNGNDLTVDQIQKFLDQKIANAGGCDTNGVKVSEFGGGTRAQYGASKGYNTPFICINQYYESPTTHGTNLGGQTAPTDAISAAQIIKNAAMTYNVSARALLVIIQKESPGPLLTDTWPFPSQYTNALGFGCPDTAPCDPQYAGFINQVSNAARQFQLYKANPNGYRNKNQTTSSVLYNPTASCGSSPVFMNSSATAGLYNYTPYQPNQPALNNLYGSGDGCSSYGNRNFWRMFIDWFGSTTAPMYAWSLTSQEAFTDAAMTKPVDIRLLAPSTQYYFRVRALNVGGATWTSTGSNPILLASTSPSNRNSVLCNTSWINCSRPAGLQEASVAPANIGTFVFSGTTPNQVASFNERFNLVAEGASWFNDFGFSWPLTVAAPTNGWIPVKQQIFLDQARTTTANIDALSPNTNYYATLQVRNTGNTIWRNDGSTPTNLATSSPQDRISPFFDNSWLSKNRTTSLQESAVAPGEIGTFQFIIKSPASYGTYKEYFRPVVDNSAWMDDLGLYWPLTVAQPTPIWSLQSQQTYTDSTMSSTSDISNTSNGSRIFVSIKAKNMGNTTWTNSGQNPVFLATNNPRDRSSVFYDSSWVGQNRAARLSEASVAPGQSGTFSFWIQTPYKTDGTVLQESFRPVVEGSAWMNDIGMYLQFTFASQPVAWQYISQGAYSDQALSKPIDLASAKTNTKYYLSMKARNTSGVVWNNSGSNPLNLGVSNPQTRTSSFYDSSWLSTNRPTRLKENTVAPGETGTFVFAIQTPSSPMTSNEYFRPVIEGQSWLTDLGVYWTIKTQ